MNQPPRISPPPFPRPPRPEPRRRPSVGRAMLLALLLGPFGLIPTSLPAAFFTGFLALVVGLFTAGSGLPVVWLLCPFLAYVLAPRAGE